MESDKYICVCENAAGNMVVIDLAEHATGSANAVQRRPIKAEAAIMNPVSKVIALRAAGQLQIFNMELRAKMKSHAMTDNIVFWRWISPNTIAMVTDTSVFHWSIEGDSTPQKVFDRHASLAAGNQIINYQVSGDSKWSLLIGISAGAAGTIQGNMQLYSAEKKVSQALQGHSGVFATITPPTTDPRFAGRTDPAHVLIFAGKAQPDSPTQLFVMEPGRPADKQPFRNAPAAIPFPADAPNDFPVSMQVSKKHDIAYMVTKMGYLYLFDIHSSTALFRSRITTDTIFATCPYNDNTGMLGITVRKGQVLRVAINDATIVQYIVTTLRNPALALAIASRANLSGADELYASEFNRLVAAGDIQGAAGLAASSPNGLLRNQQTIMRFQQMQAQPGQPQPVLQYFTILLAKGKLNKMESMELARPVLQQGRGELMEKWLKDDKLECSEELGDLVAQVNPEMALSVYLRANCPEKVINCFMQRGEFDKIVAYAAQTNYRCDYSFMLQNLVRANPQSALSFAQKLATSEGGALIDVNQVVEIFMGQGRIEQTTAFLLEALKGNKQEEGFLQTRLLEINLLGGQPQVADAIMSNNMFTFYDKTRVAALCEKAGLHQRALEHFTELDDIKRVVVNTHTIAPDFLISFFGTLTAENSLGCLDVLLGGNLRQNLNLVVQIATKYAEQIGATELVELFEKFKSYDGLYYFLGSVVNFSQDATVHFKYIEAAVKMGQFKEVERVCRDSTVYEAESVKQFLMDAKLQDPRPLIHVCNRYDFIDELTAYLNANNHLKYVEVYVQKVAPQKTPQVIGKLLDLDCNEDFIKNLLNSVGQDCPVAELVEHVEKRNRLRLLQPWLEARISQGNTETATHNAIGKIYISANRDPQAFLKNNQFYDSKVVGQFCEKLDPSLAMLAYRRAGGECDDDLIRVCFDNGLFKELARYLVEKMDLDLWGRVLNKEADEEETPSRRSLIEQVVQTALPESKNPDEVSTTVKAFMTADLPHELIELLERIVLQGSDFSNNRNLQNLLILTATKAKKEAVMDYINRLDNFDGPEIAKIAVGEQYELFEEAFVIYKKFGHNVLAVEVLLENIEAIDRAYEFADRCNESAVWSKLAKAQLDAQMVKEAISSYIKADDPSTFHEVITASKAVDTYAELVTYLQMARKKVKEAHLDTELIYSLAKCSKLADLEEFIAAPNVAQIQGIGERCFEEEMYEAAKLLFNNINNNAKLAACHVKLEQYREAVEAATKANSVSTWKEVNAACVNADEFRLAGICGLHIIVHPDHLEELILHYEKHGHSEELVKLMEQGLGLESSHSGIYTELGVLYSKYMPQKLMEHIKIFWSRMNVPKLLRACERGLHWAETVYLYKEDGQFDNAVRTMADHSVAFQHDLFLDCIQKVRNSEINYQAIDFYLTNQPMQLTRLLQVVTPNIEPGRVVHQMRKTDNLPLILAYLRDVQKENLLSAVNEAINELLVDEEDYEALRDSIDEFDNFDQIALAQKVEEHELLEFRRIAAYLFKKNQRWEQSVELSKRNKMYKDAIDTSNDSSDPDIVETLLRFFVEKKDKECLCATLHTCYDLVRPDVALELAWRNKYEDFAMPYLIQFMRHLTEKVDAIDERTKPVEEEQAEVPMEHNMAYNGPMQIGE